MTFLTDTRSFSWPENTASTWIFFQLSREMKWRHTFQQMDFCNSEFLMGNKWRRSESKLSPLSLSILFFSFATSRKNWGPNVPVCRILSGFWSFRPAFIKWNVLPGGFWWICTYLQKKLTRFIQPLSKISSPIY